MLSCAAGLLLGGQGGALAQNPAADKPASVSGVVVNGMTGAPVPRVHVVLGLDAEGNRTYGAMSGADGRFSMTGLEQGAYSITMERAGYSMPAGADLTENAPLLLNAGDSRTGLQLQLMPTGAIAGRVTNAEGEPVEGVRVEAWGDLDGGGSDTGGTTDSTGHFRIGGLAAGRYRVLAIPNNSYSPPEARTDGTVDVQDAPTYAPGALTFREGARFRVTPGGETNGVDIRLARVPIVSVSGKAEGGPGGYLRLTQKNGISRTSEAIKPDGTFRLWRLYPGEYEIQASWRGADGGNLESAPVEFEVAGSNIENLRLRPVPPADISGRLEFTDDSARPPNDARVKITLQKTGIRGGEMWRAEAGQDGTFRVAQVPAGKYRVTVQWANVFVASMQLGATAIDGSLLDLTAGAGGDLLVRVTPATGSLSGTVTDDRGAAAGARVVLVGAEDADFVPPRFARTGAEGSYSLQGLAPGNYRIVAAPEADGDYAAQGGPTNAYEDLMEPVELYPGEHLTHNLKLRDPGESR